MQRAAKQLRHGNVTHTLSALPPGDAGTRETLGMMRDIVREWREHPMVRQLALRLTSSCRERDWTCQVKRLHAFVRDSIRYVPDVYDVETLQTPELTLQQRSGDCDDQSILLAALLQSIGHPVRFVALAFADGGFSHVMVETPIGGYWVAAETIRPWQLGRRPQNVVRRLFRKV